MWVSESNTRVSIGLLLTALAFDVRADDVECDERVQLALVVDFDRSVADEEQHGLDGIFFEDRGLCGSK